MNRALSHGLRSPRRRRMRRAFWAVLGLLGPACTFDPDDRCGPNQVSWTNDERCVCAEGFAYEGEAGCVPCGENEVAAATGCDCAPGFGRPTPSSECAPLPEGIGTPCSTDVECFNPAFPHCQPSPGGSGYCTTINCDVAPCTGGYSCNTIAAPSFCQRPPVGANQPCTSNADCAGTDALFCDTFFSNTCLVRDCSISIEGCFPGYVCCGGPPEAASLCIADTIPPEFCLPPP